MSDNPQSLEELDDFIAASVDTHTADMDCQKCDRGTTWTYRMNEPKQWLDMQCNDCKDWWFDQNPPTR